MSLAPSETPERKTNQTFVYTGGTEYSFNNVILDGKNKLSRYRPISGNGGIGFVPYHGATVTMRTGDVGVSLDIKDIQPTLNNKLYWLVTDTLYEESDVELVKSLATEVPVAIVSGKYEGSFVFNNPNDYKNLYLIWDYADSMGSGGSASYSGGGLTKYLDIDLGGGVGIAGLSYNITSTPSRVIIKSGDSVVVDTGYVGLNSTTNYDDLIDAGVNAEDINLVEPLDGLVNNGVGNAWFQKKTTGNDYNVVVESPLPSTSWSLTTDFATKTSVYIDTTPRDTAEETELDCPTTNLFHDGFGTLPVAGDSLYIDADSTTPIPGNNKYYLVDSVLCVGPSTTTSRWILIDDNGIVVNTGDPHVTCTEVAAPTITQIDIDMLSSTYADMCLQATNNPTSWIVTSTYKNYEVYGGECGVIFEYTDFDGDTVTDVIGKEATANVRSSSLPVITSGSGTVTLIGSNTKGSIPPGMAFNTSTGSLSGTPTETGVYTLTVEAVNCFGTSAPASINITVSSSVKLKAFGIDSDEPQSSSALSVALTPFSYKVAYHNGTSTYPVLGDIVYENAEATVRIIGNNQWYRLNGTTGSYQIDVTGRIINIV